MDKPTAIETIDLTPTKWVAVVLILALVLENGTEEGKREARLELKRMAQVADAAKELTEQCDSLLEALCLFLFDESGKEWADSNMSDKDWDKQMDIAKTKARAAIAKFKGAQS